MVSPLLSSSTALGRRFFSLLRQTKNEEHPVISPAVLKMMSHDSLMQRSKNHVRKQSREKWVESWNLNYGDKEVKTLTCEYCGSSLGLWCHHMFSSSSSHSEPSSLTSFFSVNRRSTKDRSSSAECERRAGEDSDCGGGILRRPHTIRPVGTLGSDPPQRGRAVSCGEHRWALHPRDLCGEGGRCWSVHPATV